MKTPSIMTASARTLLPAGLRKADASGAERRSELRRRLKQATSYAQWCEAAQELDQLSGREKWKARGASGLYDYKLIGARYEALRALREAGDVRGLMYAIEEGVHGNLGGMGNPVLHGKARFGTKQLIADFVEEVCHALDLIASGQGTPAADERIDLFRRASHCYGRSALMMSSGGTLMYFHCGVVKAMLEAQVLPKIISGSSAGAIVGSIVGTRTDEALRDFFTVENFLPTRPRVPGLLERVSGIKPLYTAADFEEMLEALIPDMTFREAYETSGRHLSISVSPCERHQRPRLLNAVTSPHVLIRSAVRASCAVPGFFEPVQLQARDADGNTVPYLEQRWIDGIFAADLPARQLGRLYGVNHFIVSFINPMLLPGFQDQKLNRSHWRPLKNLFREYAEHAAKTADQALGKYLPSSQLGVLNKVLHDLLSQQFVGDINIAPQQKRVSPLKLLAPRSASEIADLIREGERQTWPRIETIRVLSKISRRLDRILADYGSTTARHAQPELPVVIEA